MRKSSARQIKDTSAKSGRTKREPKAQAPQAKVYTFDDVARLVCEGGSAPPGLPNFFRRFAWPWEENRHRPRSRHRSRKEIVAALKDIQSAADLILQALIAAPADFIMAPKYGPFDYLRLTALLIELQGRCQDQLNDPALTSSDGTAKRGPDALARPDGWSLHRVCAGAIALVWTEIHGAPPSPRNDFACDAAEALFQLVTDPVEGAEPRQNLRSWGPDPRTAWRRHFKSAMSRSPILGTRHALFLERLRAAIATDTAESVRSHEVGVSPAGDGTNFSPNSD